MTGVAMRDETVPNTVPGSGLALGRGAGVPGLIQGDLPPPPRSVLKAGPGAVQRWKRDQKAADALAQIQAAERAALEQAATERSLAQAERVAKARREPVERTAEGGLDVIGRDGLRWLHKRGKIQAVHVTAALKFRMAYETANRTGPKSCLNDHVGSGDLHPNDAMLVARKDVERALKAMASPMLEPYLVWVAGEGRMLTDPLFVSDARKASDHFLPCAIAFDSLARHYGMVR